MLRGTGVVVLLLLAGRPVLAQSSPVEPGSRIMVWMDQRVGPLEVVSADGTVVDARNDNGERVQLDLARARRIEVSHGRRSGGTAALRGGMIGLLIGGTSGAIIGFASGDDEPGLLAFSAGEKAVILGATLGAAGLVVGAIAGALNPGEEWQRTSLPVELQVQPQGSSLRLSLVHRF